jgi:hypothetical protein
MNLEILVARQELPPLSAACAPPSRRLTVRTRLARVARETLGSEGALLAVFKALAAEPAQSIVELRWRCPRVGLMTIYRNLDLFAELGLVRRFDPGDGPRYELADDHLPT